ncbi:hypothetical protein ALC60_10128 [Trachymyrmex zeteki]|uniref:Uncharacterized protein n=1 Tax=Mycetomoellerius zeteki TaxID=64791 RepID=A0A151WSH7_9HYME|nr:hypothetical protein ALC60_10128 [Trachymyrmex zeteki]
MRYQVGENSHRIGLGQLRPLLPSVLGKVPPTNNDIPRPGYLSGFDKFATNYGPESWSCRRTTVPNAYNEVAKYCETKARLTFVSLEMTFLSRHYNVAKRHAIFSGRKSRLTFMHFLFLVASNVYFSEHELSCVLLWCYFFLHIDYIQRSNTFAADLRISVTGAILRDNSIKVMSDIAKGER